MSNKENENGKPQRLSVCSITVTEKKNVDEIEELLEEEGIIKPSDGGYGWVVVFASFITNLVVDGVVFAISDSIVALWVDAFQTNSAMATIATSLLAGFYLLSGPIASAAANIFGCDKVSIAGSVIASFGIAISALPVPNLPLLYLTFGVIGGIGFGFVFLPAIVIVGQYFSERRALATGIAVCGSGIGTALFGLINPIVLSLAEDLVGKDDKWRLFLVFVSLVCLLCAISGYFFKPQTPSKKQIEKVTAIASEMMNLQQRQEDCSNHKEQTLPLLQKKSVDSSVQEHVRSPHIAEGVVIERFGPRTVKGQLKRRRLNSRPFVSTLEVMASRYEMNSDVSKSQKDVAESVTKASMASLNRPLSKMDIFYTGSKTRLDSATESRQQSIGGPTAIRSRKYSDGRDRPQKEVIYLSTAAIEEGDSSGAVEGWKNGIVASFRSMIDISLMRSPSFLILAFTGFLTLSCLFVPFMFVSGLAKQNGVAENITSNLVVILGLVNVLGRVYYFALIIFLISSMIIGMVADHPNVDPVLLSNIAVLLGGAATMIAPLLSSFWMFALYCSVFALGVAGFATLRSVICVELLGIEKLTSAYGLLMLFMGMAALIGPPFAAYLMNVTKSYSLSFVVMGGLMVLSGILSLPLRSVNRYELKKMKQTEQIRLEETLELNDKNGTAR